MAAGLMATKLWDVRAALVALFAAVPAPTVVYDGPRVRGNTPGQFLQVGVNGLDEDTAGMRAAQAPSPMSGDWRDESGEVDCTIVAWTGDTDMTAIRTAAESIVASCEALVNADRSLGGLLTPANNLAELTALDVREQRTDKGPFVEVTFTVSYGSVLT